MSGHVVLGVPKEGGGLEAQAFGTGRDLTELTAVSVSVGPGEHRADERGYPFGMLLEHMNEDMSQRVDIAASSGQLLHRLADRCLKALVRFKDHGFKAAKTAILQADKSPGPEYGVLAVVDIMSGDLTASPGGGTRGNHNRARGNLLVHARLYRGRVNRDVLGHSMPEWPLADRCDTPADVGADPRHRRVRLRRFTPE